jgi:hypothetical protein
MNFVAAVDPLGQRLAEVSVAFGYELKISLQS